MPAQTGLTEPQSPEQTSYLPGSGRALLRGVFTDPPVEFRDADLAEDHIGQLRDEENSQRALVHPGPHGGGHASLPAPPYANYHHNDPARFGRGEKQVDKRVTEEGQHHPASFLGGRAVFTHVGHETLPLLWAARITAHALSMRSAWHRGARRGAAPET